MSTCKALEKLETRLITEGSYSDNQWGQGLRLIEPALRHWVPLLSSSPDPDELDPREQCQRGDGGDAEQE